MPSKETESISEKMIQYCPKGFLTTMESLSAAVFSSPLDMKEKLWTVSKEELQQVAIAIKCRKAMKLLKLLSVCEVAGRGLAVIVYH